MNQICKNSAIVCAVGVMLVQPLATSLAAEYGQSRKRVRKQVTPLAGRPAPASGPVFSGPLPGSTAQRFNQPQTPPLSNFPNSSSVKNKKRHGQDEETSQSAAAPGKPSHGAASGGKQVSARNQSARSKKQIGKGRGDKKAGSSDQHNQSVFRESKSGNDNRPNSTPATAVGPIPLNAPPATVPAPGPPVIAVPVQTPINRNLSGPPPTAPVAPANLSPDERARFTSAHDAALRDPSLAASRDRYMQARREYREKLRDGIIRADPNVQPILEKVKRVNRNREP